jgi:trehalose-phosphatase
MQSKQTLRNFWNQLETAEEAALLLDYDGTLAPFTIVRDQAIPYTGVTELLSAIVRDTHTRLIIISGRAIDDLLPLLSLRPQPEIWGCHGWEWLNEQGERILFNLPKRAAAGLSEALAVLKGTGLLALCEIKPASVAIHWRGQDAKSISELFRHTRNLWEPLAEKYGLDVHSFNGGLELRPPGKDKGTAIEAILQNIKVEIPAAFLGDDLTDEDGFAAIKGRGIGILVSNECRPTGAVHQIAPPEGLIDFLSLWHDKAPQKNSEYGVQK